MADRPTTDPESAQAARWHRREQLGVLLSRMLRGVLTEKEGPLLRAAVETELADAEEAHRRAERAEQLLAEYVQLADITHRYAARHDVLGAGLACAGCDLRDRARAALDTAGQPTAGEERHTGDSAQDCPACLKAMDGIGIPPYPFTCPGHDAAPSR